MFLPLSCQIDIISMSAMRSVPPEPVDMTDFAELVEDGVIPGSLQSLQEGDIDSDGIPYLI